MKNTFQQKAENYVSLFLDFKKAMKSAPRTVKEYGYTLYSFYRDNPDAWEGPLQMRTAFLSWISQDIAPATYNHRLIYVRAFWRWAVEEGIQPPTPDPFRKLKRQSDPGKFRDIDAARIAELLTLPDKTTWTGLRDYTLILFTLDTATRPGEALQLIPSDFCLTDYTATIPAAVAKTREKRTLPFSDLTAQYIKRFMSVRPNSWKDDTPFFASVNGKHLEVRKWGLRLREYPLSRGTIFKPYDLRHAACTLHLRAGMSGEALQRLMGHHSPQMTQRYIHLTVDDLREQQSISSPVEKLLQRQTKAPRKIINP